MSDVKNTSGVLREAQPVKRRYRERFADAGVHLFNQGDKAGARWSLDSRFTPAAPYRATPAAVGSGSCGALYARYRKKG